MDRAAYFEMENKGEGLYLREYQEINGLDCFHMGEPLLLKVSINSFLKDMYGEFRLDEF